VLGTAGLAAAFALRLSFGIVAASYVALVVVYSRGLKHVVILDVMAIAIGFVLRAVAGGLVIGVPISDWLLVCTILGALFLGLAKRRHELTLLADGATGHRRILEEYDPYLLDQMIAVVAAATLVAYIIYCASPETDHSVPDLRHFPVPVPRASQARRRQPIGPAVAGSPAAQLRGAVGPGSRPDHLSAVRIVMHTCRGQQLHS
jgi:hypothetical protein